MQLKRVGPLMNNYKSLLDRVSFRKNVIIIAYRTIASALTDNNVKCENFI